MDFKVIFVLFLSTNSHQVLSFRKVDMRNKKSLILKITENMVTPSAILFLPFVNLSFRLFKVSGSEKENKNLDLSELKN